MKFLLPFLLVIELLFIVLFPQITFAQLTEEEDPDEGWFEVPQEVLDYIEKYGYENVQKTNTLPNDPSQVYTLPYQMEENRLTLILANTTSLMLSDISVSAADIPEGISISPSHFDIPSIQEGSYRETEFTVRLLENAPTAGTMEVLFEVSDGRGNIWEKVIRLQTDSPSEVNLIQNFPNPFNPSTIIRFELPDANDVRLDVYDMLGRRVAQLINDRMTAGRHEITFDASNLASGVYMYRLITDNQVINRQMVLIK